MERIKLITGSPSEVETELNNYYKTHHINVIGVTSNSDTVVVVIELIAEM